MTQFKKRSRMDLWQAKPLGSLKGSWPNQDEEISWGALFWPLVCFVIACLVVGTFIWWSTEPINVMFPTIIRG